MKKQTIKYLSFLAIALLVISCEKDYKDPARVTYFADIVINGEPVVIIPSDQTYNDAGAVVTENGVAIDFTTTSTVTDGVPGSYIVSYEAKNSDGFSKADARLVIIYDVNVSTADISGVYNGSVVRNGSEGYSDVPVTLTKVEGLDGIYEISDWISGFYSVGRAYGPVYDFVGMIQINASNEVVLLDMQNAFGDPFDEVIGTYDPVSETISYSAFWLEGTYEFVVVLTKN